MKGRIAEVFKSIQGEGLYLGEKQVFVRFFGCNLSCKFCDTKLKSFTEYEPEELLRKLKSQRSDCNSVVFTGGEPLLQKDFLKEALCLTRREGFSNYLETNGTLPEALEEVIGYLDVIAMDLKLPSSTGLGGYWDKHRRFLEITSQRGVFLKTVICRDTRIEDLKEALGLIKENNRATILVLQPNSAENDNGMLSKLNNFREAGINEGVTTCVIPQIHQLIGVR